MLLRRFAHKMTSNTFPKIRNAAMLVIGDEILNGKIKDTNSQFFADYCFSLGVDLRRISVVPDEEEDIISVVNDYRSKYDFVVTTGGIGPTHDDITYPTIARAFNLPLKLHQLTVDKMNLKARYPPKLKKADSPELLAQLRMAELPAGDNVEYLFISDDLWVPLVAINKQFYIFPGIPALYRKMLECLRPLIRDRIDGRKMTRRFLQTSTPESGLSMPLSVAQNKYSSEEVKLGSYPHFRDKVNTVSIIGPEDNPKLLQQIVDELAPQLENVQEVSAKQEAEGF